MLRAGELLQDVLAHVRSALAHWGIGLAGQAAGNTRDGVGLPDLRAFHPLGLKALALCRIGKAVRNAVDPARVAGIFDLYSQLLGLLYKLLEGVRARQSFVEPTCQLQLWVSVWTSCSSLGMGNLATPQRCAALVRGSGIYRLEADGCGGFTRCSVGQLVVAATLPG